MRKKRFLLGWLIAFFSLFLTACTSLPAVQQLPSQVVESRLFKLEQIEQNQVKQASLLNVQFAPNQWRWVQTDPLGSPLARVLLSPQGWQNDGFVMPNQQAQWLFSAIATALNPNTPLFQLEMQPQGESVIYCQNGRELWRVRTLKETFWIQLADGSQWQVEELIQ